MKPKGSSPYSQEPATCPYPGPDWSSPCPPHPTSRRSILILSPICAWIFQVVSFPQVSPLKPFMHLSFPLYVLHVLPISAIPFPCLGRNQRISLIPRHHVIFRNMVNFLRWGVVNTSPNPQAEGPPLVRCPRLLFQYIRRYHPYLEAVPSPATWERAMPWWQGPTYHGLPSHMYAKGTD